MKGFKRLGALVLSLTMLLSAVPATAWAEETPSSQPNVTARKKVSGPDGDGNYTITLTAKGGTKTEEVENQLPADVVLVMDTSGSMAWCGSSEYDTREEGFIFTSTVYICKRCGKEYNYNFTESDDKVCTNTNATSTRIKSAKEAAVSFVNGLLTEGSEIKVGFCDFSGSNHVKVNLTSDKDTLLNKINGDDVNANHSDGTHYDAGLNAAKSILDAGKNKQKFIIFVSDGEPSAKTNFWGFPTGEYYDGKKEADALMKAGVTIMTVGMDVVGDMEKFLKNISSPKDDKGGVHYYESSSGTLTSILKALEDTIEKSINAGEKAVMTDVINTDCFEYVAGSATGGATEDGSGNVTWNIGSLTSETKTATFKIRAKAGVSGVNIPTNKDVYLVYEDPNNNNEKVTIPKEKIGEPKVTINAKYTLKYDLNGGTSDPIASQEGLSATGECKFTITSTIPTLDADHEFLGWATMSTATAAEYASGAEITVTAAETTLYAVWRVIPKYTYTVTYNKNTTDDVTGMPSEASFGPTTSESHEFILTGTPVRADHEFLGWAETPTGTAVTSVTATKDSTAKTVYAIWRAVPKYTYTLKYDANGGTGAPADDSYGPTTDTSHEFTISSTVPTLDADHEFLGWATTSAATAAEYASGAKITVTAAETTLYAVWAEIPAAPTADDLENIATVYCASGVAEHEIKQYGAVTGGYTIGDVTGNSKDGYECIVTLDATVYQAQYNTDTNTKHSLSTDSDVEIVFTYADGEWSGEAVRIGVACESVPDRPTEDDLKGTVFAKVYCIDEVEGHDTKEYGLLEGGYTIGSVTFNSDGVYECKVTLDPSVYQAQYNTDTDTKHSLDPEGDKFVVLKYIDKEWTGKEVTIGVRCEPAPDKPTEEDLEGIVFAEVYCINNIEEHETKEYGLLEGGYTIGDVTFNSDGVYECKVTLDPSVYQAQYNTDTDTKHSLDPEGDKFVVLKYIDGEWTGKEVTIGVACEPVPDKPTEEDLEEAVLVEVYCINNIEDHAEQEYGLLEGGYTIGDITLNGNGTFEFKITFEPSVYVEKYSDDVDRAHTVYPEGEKFIVFEYRDEEWLWEPVAIGAECKDVYTITAVAGNGGSISPEGDVEVEEGSDKTFTISPKSNYVIDDVIVDGRSVGAVKKYEFTDVDANHTITAVFKKESSGSDGGGRRGSITDNTEKKTPVETGVDEILETGDHILYLNGYETGEFIAENNMTRAEVAQMFYNLLLNKMVPVTTTFSDIDDGAWYAKAVKTLASLDIISGYEDGTFRPDKAVTKAEFTAIAMRFGKLDESGENIFSDVQAGKWYYDSIVGAIKYGWISGYSDGTFKPEKNITRAEVVTIVNRMLGREADKDYIDSHMYELKNFPDLTTAHWAFYGIMEATNAHDYDKSESEIWTNVR